MALSFNAAETAALQGDADSLNVGVFYKIMTSNPIALWLGIGDCRPGIDVTDNVGLTYLGCGKLVNVESFQQIINGSAARATFVVSGVSQDLLDAAELHSNKLLNVQCWFGFNIMGGDWQPLNTGVHWLWSMRGDTVTTEQKPADGLSGPIVRTIAFAMRDDLSARRRARFSYWTDPDQQARYSVPTPDKFCQRGVLYSLGIYKKWPPT